MPYAVSAAAEGTHRMDYIDPTRQRRYTEVLAISLANCIRLTPACSSGATIYKMLRLCTQNVHENMQ